MARECYICGKKPVTGKTISRRGMAKSKGGVGQRITGKTFRRFEPNIQPISTIIDGKKRKVKACAKCIKSGNIKKAV